MSNKTWQVLVVFLMLLVGCSGAEKTGEKKEKKEKEPFVIVRPPEEETGMKLAEADSSVKSIQLYLTTRGANSDYDTPPSAEIRFPVLSMGTSDALQLEFDVLDPAGRPLSVYFYHANYQWQRDLSFPQALDLRQSPPPVPIP